LLLLGRPLRCGCFGGLARRRSPGRRLLGDLLLNRLEVGGAHRVLQSQLRGDGDLGDLRLLARIRVDLSGC
jgi:hypothetical protein